MRKGWGARQYLFSGAAVLCFVGLPYVAQAQDSDIVVTARRQEERLQDVPISVTVFNQETLAENNIVSAKELATITPGLTTSTRWGNDSTTFTIRGFSQEQRTTPTVGVYFGDVIAPRGSGVNAGGDGAGPGQLFDLQNVQVLKGPQGTLFGRNTTGGAVLIVPSKPTREVEGYVEAAIGNYDMRRVQAVANIPVSETFRLRLGIDRMTRDGYLENHSPFSRKDMGNTDFWAGRVSFVADLTPDLENYTIISYSKSKSAGAVGATKGCFTQSGGLSVPALAGGTSSYIQAPGIPVGTMACAQIERLQDKGFWAVENSQPNSHSNQEQWQIINTTTWLANDNLTIKNIISYAEFRSSMLLDTYGTYFPLVAANSVTRPDQVLTYVPIGTDVSSGYTNAQSSFVEELRFQGQTSNNKFTWQAGLYLEINNPLGASGSQTGLFTPCNDLDTFDCRPREDGASVGSLTWGKFNTSFRGMAAYAQATYALSDKLSFTGGIRYTHDKMKSDLQLGVITLPGVGTDPYFTCTNLSSPGFDANKDGNQDRYAVDARFGKCLQNDSHSTSAPTWTVDVTYRPMNDWMMYAKYTRGYRQGGLVPMSADTARAYDKEQVDTYEIGTKASWRGAIPGNLSLAAFYNDFGNQQLQLGLYCAAPCSPTTAIANVGKSRIYGLDAELTIMPFTGLRLSAAYSYLNSKMTRVTTPTVPGYVPVALVAGTELPYAMPHNVTASAEYTLPLPEAWGRVSFGGTFIYQSRYKVSTTVIPERGFLPGYKFGNVNLNWYDVAGLPIDASAFISNVTNEKMYTNIIDNSTRMGFINYALAEPRMYGVRLRFKWGQ